MRLKVAWKEHKLVIPSGDTNDKVSRLLKDIANRFQPFSNPTEEFLISELRTNDGYLISPHISIIDALNENDYLVAIDFETWKNNEYKLCNKNFFGNTLSNFEEDNSISCSVGLHAQNKLYVSIAQYKKLLRLDLFDASDLRSFAKEGKHLVSHWEDENGNYAKLYFHVKQQVVYEIESELKTVSALIPEIQIYELKVSAKGKIEAGDKRVVQVAYDNTPITGVVVPSEVRTGNSFPDYDMDYYTTDGGNAGAEEKQFTTVTSGSGVRFEQLDITRSELQSTNSNQITINGFYTDFQIVNTTEKKLTITKITGEYQNKEGNWVSTNAYFGFKSSGNYNYQWRWDPTLILIEARETIKLSTNTRIEIPAAQGKNAEKLYRSHASLPNPLNIRLTITDDTQTVTVIPLKYQNKTEHPVFVTEKYKIPRLSSSDGKMVHFQTVDDFANNCRAFVQILEKEDQGEKVIVYSTNLSNSYYTLRQNVLHDFAYSAYKAKESKFRIKDYSCAPSNGHFTLDVFAIVDLEKRRTTALCFEMANSDKSSTSSKYFVIPTLGKPQQA
ncbi:hypothetical protein DLAC_08207 [Tieghemostelium lacteum]|uniref:Uncharacterized protein n=1 Tax=Tieghemostelium lacteum TaxID=361077 RepID=A0A151ZBE6_TIELA|nr:hypothetical protein DLAC_08207 [Tieghemostelium lacteum]|eukprot:KYQ91270.1 hypothetical protein DLAC_08207 [Tieghemostelium lacteum]